MLIKLKQNRGMRICPYLPASSHSGPNKILKKLGNTKYKNPKPMIAIKVIGINSFKYKGLQFFDDSKSSTARCLNTSLIAELKIVMGTYNNELTIETNLT